MTSTQNKFIPGSDRNYLITDKGVVSSRLGRELSPNKLGQVCLSIGGKRYVRYVHRLMATTFLGLDIDTKDVVVHKDGDRFNNVLENLEVRKKRGQGKK